MPALIIGVSGQDGAYLSELLLRKRSVDAMWRMLQQDRPDDYVIGTGETRSLEEFVETAFGAVVAPALGWRATVKMDEVVRRMVEAARQMLSRRPGA